MVVRHVFNHNCTETALVCLWMSNIYIRVIKDYTLRFFFDICNHVVELLSIRIVSRVIIDKSRGCSDCTGGISGNPFNRPYF
jgi:hypothetical protein